MTIILRSDFTNENVGTRPNTDGMYKLFIHELICDGCGARVTLNEPKFKTTTDDDTIPRKWHQIGNKWRMKQEHYCPSCYKRLYK